MLLLINYPLYNGLSMSKTMDCNVLSMAISLRLINVLLKSITQNGFIL